ncbi:hypothetical protein [Salarchaeum sp. JOR-1]|uniref:hypothetical protein n=1 Tax=Salarchaeum sp. JOR-1 TaxID=2599399 RepID=UPI001198A371|nr:hypothetical protein [Salarchaeum sp. JOR-1]QDX39701.1 hypothetical protein FQU85_01870 [Salarchaeum sp. JOR-1]
MRESEDAVLRVLSQAGIAVSPGGIAANLRELYDVDRSEAAVADALDALEDENYVRALDDTYYRITGHGRDYVTSEFGDDAPGYVE